MYLDDIQIMFKNLLEEIHKIYQSDTLLFNTMGDAIRTAYKGVFPKGYNGKDLVKYKSKILEKFDQINRYYSLKVLINEYNVGEKIGFETYKLAGEYGIEDYQRLASYVTLEKALTTVDKFYEFFLSNGICMPVPYPQVAYAYYNCFFRREIPMKSWAKYKELKDSELNPANRNAKIASYETLSHIAKNLGDDDIYAIYTDLLNKQELIGYENSEKGAIYNYLEQLDPRVLEYFLKMDESYIVSENDRVKCGLPISKNQADLVRKRVM